MVPRIDSVPTGSPQAPQIPDWFKYVHPDLRVYQNALIVVARLHGFNLGNMKCPTGIRFAIWEAKWAHIWLSTIAATDDEAQAEIWEEVRAFEGHIANVVQAAYVHKSSRRKGGAA